MLPIRKRWRDLAVASLLVLLLAPVARGDEPAGSEDGAGQAFAVFQRHCVRCHGKDRRGGVSILDRAGLIDQGRLVRPGEPDESLLLDLVEGGSMPPGERPKLSREERSILREWVRSGAPPFPTPPDSGSLLGRLVADFGKVPAVRAKHVRYIGFSHIPAARAAPQIAALRAVLRYLSAEGKAGTLEPIDKSGDLFRIDLQEPGWHRQAFKDEKLTLFDLVLLEYPYGVLPKTLDSGLAAFLAKTAQVRPIPFVRGDWLVRALTTGPLHRDFLESLNKPKDSDPPNEALGLFDSEVAWEDALREVETSSDGKLKQVIEGIPGVRLLAQKKPISRAIWERHFPEVVRRLGAAVPIVPVDGLTWLGHDPESVPKVRFYLIDAKGPRDKPEPKKSFIAGKERFAIHVRADEDTFIEVVYTDYKGKQVRSGKKVYSIKAGQPLTFAGKDGEGFQVVAAFPGKQVQETFTLYAYPKTTLGRFGYPGGRILKGETVPDRLLHPLYALAENGKSIDPPDPGNLVKITVQVTFVKPDE